MMDSNNESLDAGSRGGLVWVDIWYGIVFYAAAEAKNAIEMLCPAGLVCRTSSLYLHMDDIRYPRRAHYSYTQL